MRISPAIAALLIVTLFTSFASSISESEVTEPVETSTWQIHLQFDEPCLEYRPEGVSIKIEGVENDPRASALSIPRMKENLQIPVNSRILSVDLEDPVFYHREMDLPIARNPLAVPSADLSLWERIQEDVPIPKDHFEYLVGTGIDLDTGETVSKLSFSIYPCVPVNGGLRYLRSATLKMEYREPLNKPIAGEETYDLLVLCPDTFKDEMEVYSQYRNQSGVETRVVTLTDIFSDNIWNITGVDAQEEMKKFTLEARSNWSITSVLLVGDVNVMPARQIMVLDGYDDSGNSDGRFLPSDLYFADLYEEGTTNFCSWNDRNDDYHADLWGEYSSGNLDGVDFYPDVTIGRIPASSESELDLMLDKLMNYELLAMGSGWFKNATVCGTNTFVPGYPHYDGSGVNEGEYMSDLISSGPLSEFNATKHYESLGNLNSIAATVNEGCGFFEMSDHGGYDGWGYAPGASVTNSMAFGLSNGYKLPVVVLDACLTHGFDNDNATGDPESFDPVFGYSYYPPGSSRVWRDCLGEQFHKAPDGGAVATYGCTRVGYGAYGSSYSTRNSGYINLHIHEAYDDGYDMAGEMLAKAMGDYMGGPGPGGSSSFKTLTEYVLLGDPTLTVGGVNGANIEIASNETDIGVLPNLSRVVEFNMTNTGFMADQINLDTFFEVGDVGSWILDVEPRTADISPGEIINGTLTLKAPERALMGTEKKLVIQAEAYLMSEPEKYIINVIVERSWGLDVVSDPDSASTIQTGVVAGHLNLTNHGNGPEMVDINFTGMPAEWELELGSAIAELDPFDEDRIPFRISIPSRFLAGNYVILVECGSVLDPAYAFTNLTIILDPEYDLVLEVASGRMDIGPGENGMFFLNLTNNGNSEVDVDLQVRKGDHPGWNFSFSSDMVTVPAFSHMDIGVNVDSPDLVPPRTYQVFVNASDGVSTASTYATINVTKLYKFDVICAEPVKVQNGNGATYFDLNIHNQGNIYDIYEFSSDLSGKEGWTFNPELSEVSIDSNIIRRNFRVTFSNLFPLKGNYTFPLTVTPRSGIAPKTLELKVVVPAIFNFTADSEITDPEALPGRGVGGSIRIETESNCRDSYSIIPVLTEGFIFQLDDGNLSLDPGQSLTVNFTVRSSSDALAGPYPVKFRVISIGSGWNVTLTETVHVEEIYGMGIDLVSGLTGELVPGETYQMTFMITNNGNTPDNAEIDINCSGYVMGWVRLEGSYFSSIDPGENRTVRIVIVVPSWNVTEGEYNISVCMSSFGEDIELGNYTFKVQGSKDENGNGSFNWAYVIVAGMVAFVIILTVIIMAVIVARRNAAMDVDEAGLEWESDEEDEDEEDWDDWEQ